MSREGSTSRLSSLSSYRSGNEPRLPISCNLHTWQRLQSLAKAIKTNDELLETYKEEIDDADTIAPLVEAYNMEAEIANIRVTNEMKANRIEQLRRMCAKKRLDIAKLKDERGNKAKKVEELERRCSQAAKVVVCGQRNLDQKLKFATLYGHLIRHRTKNLLSALRGIFQIELRDVSRKDCSCKRIDTICGIHLPPLNSLAGHADAELSAALGYLVHLLKCISKILDYPFRYPVKHSASTSYVVCVRDDKRFPLFGTRWKADRQSLDVAVNLLARNVAQLRADTGLQSPDLNKILQSVREWMEVVIHGRGQITYVHRPWLQLGTPALLMDSLDDTILHPLGVENGRFSPRIEHDRTESITEDIVAEHEENGAIESDEEVDLNASVVSSLTFEDTQEEEDFRQLCLQ